ncbi:hypothetical protein DKX38_015286 [Salix brachista]|uniref:Protein kish n=1 Tax=Salix brachista TaxID=2182728 RepID=A0A5N5L4S7_9ROSI|nr:hypothetical protein DKX38_015286 [Salix brachista]
MSALFNFHSFLTVVLLGICTCTFVKMHFPAILEQRNGVNCSEWNMRTPITSFPPVNGTYGKISGVVNMLRIVGGGSGISASANNFILSLLWFCEIG